MARRISFAYAGDGRERTDALHAYESCDSSTDAPDHGGATSNLSPVGYVAHGRPARLARLSEAAVYTRRVSGCLNGIADERQARAVPKGPLDAEAAFPRLEAAEIVAFTRDTLTGVGIRGDEGLEADEAAMQAGFAHEASARSSRFRASVIRTGRLHHSRHNARYAASTASR